MTTPDPLEPPAPPVRDKTLLLLRLESVQDAAVLAKLHTLLDVVERHQDTCRLISDHLEVLDPHHEPDDHQLQTHLQVTEQTPLTRWEDWSYPLMFYLSLGYFGLFSLMLAWASLPEGWAPLWLWQITLGGLGSLWLVFIAEYLFLRPPPGVVVRQRWLHALLPFTRLAAPRLSQPRQRWLPFWGWCVANTALIEALQKRIDWPLTLVALLILPVLLGDLWLVTAQTHPAWVWLFELIEYPVIWLAFATEFTLLFLLSRDKLDYAIRRWMDIVIILLPLVSFLRVLRLAQLLRVGQLARAYRLRVLSRRGVILGMALWRLLAPYLPRNHAAELRRLRRQLATHELAQAHIEQRIAELIADYHEALDECRSDSGRNATT